MLFRLGVNAQHVTESKKGRNNPSGETTLASMALACPPRFNDHSPLGVT